MHIYLISSMDHTNINFLVSVLSYSYTRCYFWEKLAERYTGSLCTFFFFFQFSLNP